MQRSKFNSESTIIIKCSVFAATELLPLLKELKLMGNVGCSRAIKIEDWEGKKNLFGFDGDEPSSIGSITHDGKLIKSKIKASCGDELEYKLKKEGLYIKDKKKKKKKRATKSKEKNMDLTKGKAGIRGVPDGSGPEGKGTTGRQLGGCPRREGFKSDEEYEKAFRRWQKANKVKKSQAERKIKGLKKAGIALVLIPGELTKAAKLSAVGSKHPAGLSGVSGKTKSKIPYTGHAERMKLTKMAAARMLAPKPEDEGKYAYTSTVDRKGRVKGAKSPYNKYATGVSGMGSQAHDNFGRATIIVKPSEIGSSTPEGSTAHTPVSNIR